MDNQAEIVLIGTSWGLVWLEPVFFWALSLAWDGQVVWFCNMNSVPAIWHMPRASALWRVAPDKICLERFHHLIVSTNIHNIQALHM
jgi:hypothetical protein